VAHSKGGSVFSRIDLEGQIAAEVENLTSIHGELPVSYAPPRVHAPSLSMPDDMAIPDYVEHTDRDRKAIGGGHCP
jgi:hypothetical protein